MQTIQLRNQEKKVNPTSNFGWFDDMPTSQGEIDELSTINKPVEIVIT